MSEFDFRAAREAIYDSDLSIYAKAVLVQLVEHMPNCRPSVARIAKRGSMSTDQAMDEIKFLEALGVIVVKRRPGVRSEYGLVDGWQAVLPVDTSHQSLPATRGQEPPPPLDTSQGTPGHQPPPPVAPSHPKQEVKQNRKQEVKQRSRARATTPKSAAVSRKKPKTDPPETLSPTDATLRWAERYGRNWQNDWEDCRNWHLKNGVQAADWQAALRTWMKKAPGFEASRVALRGPRKAPPQQHGRDEHIEDGSWLDDEPPKPKLAVVGGSR